MEKSTSKRYIKQVPWLIDGLHKINLPTYVPEIT